MTFHAPNDLRLRNGPMASSDLDGNNGMFYLSVGGRNNLTIIASDGEGWEHVSVSKRYETPSWEEMCRVKNIFWDKDDCVVQFHPPESEYVNNHPFCLHLWRPTNQNILTPPMILVGVR